MAARVVKGLTFYGALGKFTWRMLATVLAGESVIVFFGALVARGLAEARNDSGGQTWLAVGSALAVLCIVGAATMRRPWGVTLGWLIQAATFASALVVPAMFLVGLIFLALWLLCMVQGQRVDALQARREDEAAGQAGPPPSVG